MPPPLQLPAGPLLLGTGMECCRRNSLRHGRPRGHGECAGERAWALGEEETPLGQGRTGLSLGEAEARAVGSLGSQAALLLQ